MKIYSIKFFYTFILLGVFLISPTLGANVPDKIEFQGTSLNLNGHGTRVVFFMKVYEGSLYLKNKSSSQEEIINNDQPMAIRIDVTSEMVTSDAMKKALNEGLEKSTNNNTDPISKEINQLSLSFNTSVSSGDYYEFIYIPKKGTHILKNHELEQLIEGLEFKKAFFGIFLSDNPIQKNLKKAMLGG
jgi:hypothetical protein